MVVRSDEHLIIGYIGIVILLEGMVCAVFAQGFISMGVEGIILLLVIMYAYVPNMIFNCRTLIMDSEGCTVKFYKFTKKYKWSELHTRRMEYYCMSGRDSRRGVVFAKGRIGSMNRSHPSKYAQIRPLISCFYVTFNVAEDEKTSKSDFPFETKYYEVDEKKFMDKMHEWGVRIENGLPLEKRQKYPWDWV